MHTNITFDINSTHVAPVFDNPRRNKWVSNHVQATGGSKCQHALCFLTEISSTARVSLRVLIFRICLFLSGEISTLSLVKFKNKLTLLRVYYKEYTAVHFFTHAESPPVPDPIFFWNFMAT